MSHERLTFECPDCSEKFLTQLALQGHMHVHEMEAREAL